MFSSKPGIALVKQTNKNDEKTLQLTKPCTLENQRFDIARMTSDYEKLNKDQEHFIATKLVQKEGFPGGCDLRLMLSSEYPPDRTWDIPRGENSAYVLYGSGKTPTALYFIDRSDRRETVTQITQFTANHNLATFISAFFPGINPTYKEILNLTPAQIKTATSIVGNHFSEISYENLSLKESFARFIPFKELNLKYEIMLKVAKILQLCHQHEVFYGELNPRQVFISSDLNPRLAPVSLQQYALEKIITWEVFPEKIYYSRDAVTEDFSAMSVAYIAPELLYLYLHDNELNYTKHKTITAAPTTADKKIAQTARATEKSDVYAFGRLMYFMRHSADPWSVEEHSRTELIPALEAGWQPAPMSPSHVRYLPPAPAVLHAAATAATYLEGLLDDIPFDDGAPINDDIDFDTIETVSPKTHKTKQQPKEPEPFNWSREKIDEYYEKHEISSVVYELVDRIAVKEEKAPELNPIDKLMADCCQLKPSERPTLKEVILRLEKIRSDLKSETENSVATTAVVKPK